MAKLKMLKLPKKPTIGKKPAQTASLSTKQAWMRRLHDKKQKYEAKHRAIESENKKRRAINEASQKASTVISGIGDIMEVRPGSFSVKSVRGKRTSYVPGAKHRKKKSAVGSVGRKRKPATKKKAAPKRKRR